MQISALTVEAFRNADVSTWLEQNKINISFSIHALHACLVLLLNDFQFSKADHSSFSFTVRLYIVGNLFLGQFSQNFLHGSIPPAASE